ncbi:beta-N-acetylhexosaminidase [Mucilaginibacter sp. BT774]|uniref:beta-N-acetylhexosaminidase n=1 Tax=Mucilaginibacter sp. BT774 TaxID=3062276 RepID=UPI002675D160|nr:family 20 glycosylhydrolase [Mucilaginibacter sp. BT774]MDO3625253.1 family 20 glycosylhydrolase [Mucilaginibacter sp. BT774]
MKKLLGLLCLSFIALHSFGQSNRDGNIAIIPEPVSLTQKEGEFTLPKRVIIETATGPEMKQIIATLRERFSVPTGSKVVVLSNAQAATIKLILNKKADDALGKEGYNLAVTPKGIFIKANGPAGLFYGAQTLVQLFPKEIVSNKYVANVSWMAPCVEITDYPRFKWRGLMFDVARHFFTKAEVEQYIDNMVKYKMNLLHLHLTDDEGWRIEIKSLPRLTTVGAYNVKKVGYFGNFSPPGPDEPRDYGGFYTQKDIKEIVQYAKDRFVDILPEIDVPGHSLAAVVAYPELSCTPGADKYQVRSGEHFMNFSKDGIKAGIDNTLCPANEKVYDFLDKVLTEVAQLFPFGYIHMGGDECAKNFWEQSDAIKALMQKENLKTQEEVQSYFEKRIEKIVESKGKKFMGWDEILEGGLAPDAIVMSWRGMKGGIQAAKMGHEVVMSPTTFAYLDYMNGDPAIEPRVYSTLRLNKAYQFDPAPDSVDSKLIIGGQANLWTEQVYNTRHLEYMTWPRAFAIAEAVWSPKSVRNFDDFASRVEKHFDRFDVAQTKYAPSVYDPIFTAKIGADTTKTEVELSTEVKGLDIHYTFDNSFPDQFYPKYTAPLLVPTDAYMLRVITYKGDKPVGRLITITVDELKKRAKSKRNYPNNDD